MGAKRSIMRNILKDASVPARRLKFFIGSKEPRKIMKPHTEAIKTNRFYLKVTETHA